MYRKSFKIQEIKNKDELDNVEQSSSQKGVFIYVNNNPPPNKITNWTSSGGKNLWKGGNICSWKFISKCDDLSTYFIAFQARLPGSTIRRAMASASITGTPRSRNMLEIVLFPVATPPYKHKNNIIPPNNQQPVIFTDFKAEIIYKISIYNLHTLIQSKIQFQYFPSSIKLWI